ncbi:AAA family ATPase [Conexibacter arvalis]|uniref:DNA-binding CsgD family transcriptional regulator/tetratricopeptide (TPR) repeat protein n=1 Tax=Conexibacter arvalis TaxID=912552 RepID=A0A840IAC9_9ACTN|nr:DNA-binding CsgD family transcriptional regulator/tetratricopeptide (TPR) repeat protein [Conexibacter arvalis]
MSSAEVRRGAGSGDAPRRRAAAHALDSDPLEREEEIAALREALDAADASEGRIVVLEGTAGVGKSHLLGLAAREAQRRGLVVLRARGGELERQYPFGVALQLFEPYLSAASPRERRRVLAGAAAHAEPALTGRVRIHEASGPPEFPLLHGLHWVAENIAEHRPLLLAVDDAHASDDASMRALLYTAQRSEDLPLLIVVTTRPRPTADGDALAALASHPRVRRIDLSPLSGQAVAVLVRAALPGAEEPFCAACWRVTGGNPFFTRELLAELVAAAVAPTAANAARVADFGPTTIARATAGRLDRLAPGAARLAQAVAVLGDPAPFAQAAALAALAPAQARVAADALATADVLRPAADLGFVHPIVNQAVHLEIPAAERAQLHLEAARLLKDDGDAGVDRAAAHLLQTLPVREPWSLDCLHAAARRALAGGSPETAARYLLRALDEGPSRDRRAQLLIDLGRADALAGRPSAPERLRDAIALLDQPQARARALAQLGHALYAASDNDGAARAFDEGLRVLGDADPELEEELTAGYLSAARLDFRTREAALTRFADLLSGTIEATTPAQRELLAQRALEHVMLGTLPWEDAVAQLHRALGGDRMLREVTSDGTAYVAAGAGLFFSDALDDVERMTSAGLDDARARGSVVGFAAMSALRGAARYLRGELVAALGDLEGGIERLPVMIVARPWSTGYMALALLDRGETEAAARLLDDGGDRSLTEPFTYNWMLLARGRLLLATGDPAAALETLLECGRRQAAIPAPSPSVLPWRSEAAIAALKLERGERARELAHEELRRARAVGAPRTLGTALRVAGLVAGGTEGLALLEEAVAALERSPARLELARALVDLGGARRRARQRSAARETLRIGLDAAYRCGATGLAAQARAELVAAGARPRRPALSGVQALTPSERRVSELAAGGLTNREIAQALFVSTKTVEFHLRNAYLKLRIHSRRELAGALGDERPGAVQARP